MSAVIDDLIIEIDAISSLDDEASLARLEQLVAAYFLHPQADRYIDVWFRMYERFPEHDAFGIFWSVLHGLEKQLGCPIHVVQSVQRAPSSFAVRMLARIANSGMSRIADIDLVDLMDQVSKNQRAPESVRDQAREYLASSGAGPNNKLQRPRGAASERADG